jgi:hypothetical protein
MTKEKETPETLTGTIIKASFEYAKDNPNVDLAVLIGEIEVAKLFVHERMLDLIKDARASGQSEDADTPGQVVAFQDEGEDKDES